MNDGFEQALHGLLRKRAEMARDVEAHRQQIDVLMAGLEHIDGAIRVLNPAIDLEDMPERPLPPPSAAFRGEVQRFLLDTLRKAGEPMMTTQLAEIVMESRRLNTADRVLFKLIRKRTGHSLSGLRRNGFVASERYSKGAELQWWLTSRGAGGEPVGGWRNGSSG